MKFLEPAGANAIDKQTIVTQPVDRIDGRLKTSGGAKYGYEHLQGPGRVAYGYVVGARIAKGRIRSIDVSQAKAAPGVLAIVTADDAGKLGKGKHNFAPLLGGPEIAHYHQAVAVVVAESFEQARACAALVRVDYAAEKGAFDLAAARANGEGKPAPLQQDPADTHVGDFDRGFAEAPVKLDETYTTPDQSHAMMEPHASVARWDGDRLTLWTSSQMVDWHRTDLAATLGVDKEQIRLMSPFIGGGFGSKLFLRADALLAALGARAAQRPVKLALPRPLIFNNTTHRPATIQRIRIGADGDGKILAIAHESWSGNVEGGPAEAAVAQTRLLYAGANRLTTTRLAHLDLPEGNSMRAPGEASGMMALEIAMDEMAEKLNLDPVEFRLRNDTEVDPEKPERKFSLRNLKTCLSEGAERFGWSNRPATPASRREGDLFVGYGMAAAFRNNIAMKSAARVRLDAQGRVTVETDMTDIGTGSYTIIAQTAAETLGVPLTAVAVRLGSSDFPVSCGSGGQFGAVNSTSGVYAACMKLREAIAGRLGLAGDSAFVEGHVVDGERRIALAEAAAAGEVVAEDGIEYGDLSKRYQESTFGAHFCEVTVDADSAEIRVRRMLAVCAAGRILNPKTARSQVIGAMTMGVGAALMEDLNIDERAGCFINHDLAAYEVPVHADIPHQDVIFLDEVDPIASPMKAKGVGELGLCGVAAAVANAVYNAVGVRVRDYPITLDKLIARMPQRA
jgi:xanthine dehydrogenase YagR molybdenum-binding subunit